MGKSSAEERQSGDVLIVAHGHILRAFAMRWIGKGLTEGISLLLEGKSSTQNRISSPTLLTVFLAGGVGALRYVPGTEVFKG